MEEHAITDMEAAHVCRDGLASFVNKVEYVQDIAVVIYWHLFFLKEITVDPSTNESHIYQHF